MTKTSVGIQYRCYQRFNYIFGSKTWKTDCTLQKSGKVSRYKNKAVLEVEPDLVYLSIRSSTELYPSWDEMLSELESSAGNGTAVPIHTIVSQH